MSLVNFVSDLPSVTVRGDILYQATVVDRVDPLRIGRVRIRVNQFFPVEFIPNSHCPWAIMKRTNGYGSSPDRSNFSVPELGSKVLVQFNGGDIYSPIYETSPPDKLSTLTDFDTNYPNRSGWKDPDGSSLMIDFIDHTLDYVHKSGFEVHVRQDTNVDISFPHDKTESILQDEIKNVSRDVVTDIGGKVTETIVGNLDQTVTGNIAITSSGNITITGVNIKLGTAAVDYVALLAGLTKLRTQLDTHVHSGVTAGGANTGVATSSTPALVPAVDYTTITKAI